MSAKLSGFFIFIFISLFFNYSYSKEFEIKHKRFAQSENEPKVELKQETNVENKSDEQYFSAVFSPLGAPWPLQLAGETNFSGMRVGLNYGLLPSMSFDSGINAESKNLSLYAHYHPYKTNFYSGLGLGRYEITGSKKMTISGYGITFTGEAVGLYLYPHAGWRWKYKSGWFFGIEFGLIATLQSDVTTTAPAPYVVTQNDFYNQQKQEVEDMIKIYTKQIIPQLTLIQVGYDF